MLAEVDCTKKKFYICRHKNDFFMQHVTTAWCVQTRLSTTVHVELKIDMLGCKLENDCSQPHTVHASTSVWTHPVCACSSWSCLTARTPGKGSTWRLSCTVSMENYWDSERTSANRSTISSSGTCCSFLPTKHTGAFIALEQQQIKKPSAGAGDQLCLCAAHFLF